MTRDLFLIGAGGTGSFLYPALIRFLNTTKREDGREYTLTVIDGKLVAEEKLYRQLFSLDHIGNNKAAALVEQYDHDPAVIIALPDYLRPENIQVLPDGAYVLIAADNFPVRARIEDWCGNLTNATVINGGNEMTDGSMQIYLRRDGVDVTPRLSQGHPEILQLDRDDPATLSCDAIAALPGGQQTIIANMMSATAILNGLRHVLQMEKALPAEEWPFHMPEEVFFDMDTFAMRATQRPTEPTPS